MAASWFHMVCEIWHKVRNFFHSFLLSTLQLLKLLLISYAMWKFCIAMRNCWLLDFFSDSLPCIHDWLGKGLWSSKAWIFHVIELQLALPWTTQSSPSFLACFNDKKATKTPKLVKNWLVTLARVLNVPIELKGINYYSKVFKIVNFKL